MNSNKLNISGPLFVWIFLFVILIVGVDSNRSTKGIESSFNQVWKCGTVDEDVDESGTKTNSYKAPWVVGIYKKEVQHDNYRLEYMQTGTLVGLKTVITCGSPELNSIGSLGLKYLFIKTSLNHLNSSYYEVRKIEDLKSVSKSVGFALDWTDSSDSGNLYLIHLKKPIILSPFSRPICLDLSLKIFEHRRIESSESVFLTGHVSPKIIKAPPFVHRSPQEHWKMQILDEDAISLQNNLSEHSQIRISNAQKRENFDLPSNFHSGSALVFQKWDRWYLMGVNLAPGNRSSTQVRSIEKLTEVIHENQQCASFQLCDSEEEGTCLPASCDNVKFTCKCKIDDNLEHCLTQNSTVNFNFCKTFENIPSKTTEKAPYIPGKSSTQDLRNSEYYEQTSQQRFSPNIRISTTTINPHSGFIYTSGSRSSYTPIITTSKPFQTLHARETQILCPKQLQPQRHIEVSCLHPNGTNAGLLCLQRPVEIGSTAIFTCSSTKATLWKICDLEGQWDHVDKNLECPRRSSSVVQAMNAQSNGYPRPAQVVKAVTCPAMDLHEGIQVKCIDENGENCTLGSSFSVGNVLKLSCKPFYTPLKDTTLEKRCDDTGHWLPRKQFACSLDCGKTEISKLPFVVHGVNIQSDIWPWHASLFLVARNGKPEYLCGATLISRSILITAAHCFPKYNMGVEYLNNFKVVIGAISSNYSENLEDDQAQLFNINNVTIYPDYNRNSYEGDIAVVRLSKTVRLTEYVRPACFPYPGEKFSQLERYQLSEGNLGYVAGFGLDESWNASKTLKIAKLPYVSIRECTRVLTRQPALKQYCAGYTNGTSVCEGDSGGGMLFLEENYPGRFYIQGIVSYGNRDDIKKHCDNTKYTVYTKVSEFKEWVKSLVDVLDYDYQ